MKRFLIDVTRTSVYHGTMTVEAPTWQDAQDIAQAKCDLDGGEEVNWCIDESSYEVCESEEIIA